MTLLGFMEICSINQSMNFIKNQFFSLVCSWAILILTAQKYAGWQNYDSEKSQTTSEKNQATTKPPLLQDS